MPITIVHRLDDEERGLLTELVSILNRLIEDPNAVRIGRVSAKSDKMEVEAKNLQEQLTKKTGD